MKVFDSELQILNVLWEMGDLPASWIVDVLKNKIGWNKNTTYTVIKKCVEKRFVSRNDPGFLCHALITLEEVQKEETRSLTDRLFDGAADKLFAALITGKKLTDDEIRNIQRMIREME